MVRVYFIVSFCVLLLPANATPVVLMGASNTSVCAESLNNQPEPLQGDANATPVVQSWWVRNRFEPNLLRAAKDAILFLKLGTNSSVEQAMKSATQLGYYRFIVSSALTNISWMTTSERETIRVYAVSDISVTAMIDGGIIRVFVERMLDLSVFVIAALALVALGIGAAWAASSAQADWMVNAQRWLDEMRGDGLLSAQNRPRFTGIPIVFPENQATAKETSKFAMKTDTATSDSVGGNDYRVLLNLNMNPSETVSMERVDQAASLSAASESKLGTQMASCETPVNNNEAGVEIQDFTSNAASKNSTAVKDDLSLSSIIVSVATLCTMLLLLYFFYDYLVYVFIGFFAFGSAHSTYQILVALFGSFTFLRPIWPSFFGYRFSFKHILRCRKVPGHWRERQSLPVGRLLLAACCLSLSFYWVAVRRTSYSWILQDFLGVSLCTYIIKSFAVAKLKSLTILLSLLVIYDVIMVFISPFFVRGIRSLFLASAEFDPLPDSAFEFPIPSIEEDVLFRQKRGADKDSVMIDVITGMVGNSGEQVPLTFRVPSLLIYLNYCPRSAWTMLGFGDVIVPGLLVAFAHKFGRVTRTRVPYFLITFVGYFCGLAVCFVSALTMRSGQPALLFVIPLTLIPVLIAAGLSGHFNEIWTGMLYKHLPATIKAQLGDFDERAVDDRPQQSSDNALESARRSHTEQNDAANGNSNSNRNVQLFSVDSDERLNGHVPAGTDREMFEPAAETQCLLTSR